MYMGRTVGNNSEFFSDMLAVHVEKGISGRVEKGLHLGAIPFGYESCWTRVGGERQRDGGYLSKKKSFWRPLIFRFFSYGG